MMVGQPLRKFIRTCAGAALLVLALLAGQHAAVSHQIWHASGAHGLEGGKTSPEHQLCDFHSALDTVLGLVTMAVVPSPLVEPPHTPFAPAVVLTVAATPPLPSSRGPPFLAL
jgi:hypothetical protein